MRKHIISILLACALLPALAAPVLADGPALGESVDAWSADLTCGAELAGESFCEAVVCSKHIGKECFEPIADAGVTRYDGTGLGVIAAAHGAEDGTLPLIPDYEGGTGCGSGTGECHEHGE